jgi:hypothetical protein
MPMVSARADMLEDVEVKLLLSLLCDYAYNHILKIKKNNFDPL